MGNAAAAQGSDSELNDLAAIRIRGDRNEVFRTRQSSEDLHLPWLDDQWASGCRNLRRRQGVNQCAE